MKKGLRRIVSLMLACLLLLQLPVVGGGVQATEVSAQAGDALYDTVAEQVKAFAKSINQSDADDEAAWALAKHGVGGSGKKLSVGKSHALTATLMNSELGLATVLRGCAMGIRVMQQLGRESVFDDGGCNWGTSPMNYSTTIYPSADTSGLDVLDLTGFTDFTGKTNAYDSSLAWMAASTQVHSTITREQVTDDAITYKVSVKFEDRFDFSTGSGSVPKDIASLLGSVLFKEFDWVATAEFSVTVPNECAHSSYDYYWRYDADAKDMVCVVEGDFAENRTTRHSYTNSNGAVSYHYELERAVTLYHDLPWELEYTVKNPGRFMLSPTARSLNKYLDICVYNRSHFFIQSSERRNESYNYHCYGYTFANLFNYAKDQTYTVRLENVLQADGGNMIYVSVYNNDLQQTVLEPQPMDDYYLMTDGTLQLQDTEAKALSGVDLRINYIGNRLYRFSADTFELKVWENGKDGENDGSFADKVTESTCSQQGYTTRTCYVCDYTYNTAYTDTAEHTYTSSLTIPTCDEQGYKTYTCVDCGHSYKDNFVDPLGHTYGEWTESRAPSCAVAGEEQRVCAICEHIDTRETVFAEHDYLSEVVPSTCTEQGYTLHTCNACGHSYTDSFVETAAHAMGEWTVTQEATCAAEGEKRRDCDNCDYFETEKTPKLAHEYEAVVTAPTCTEKGYTTHICSCGDSYVDTYVDAGHTVVTVPAKTPTATENGLTEGECCSGCGEVYVAQQVIPAIGAASALPKGYQRVDYLEGIGDAYIDTGLAARSGDKLILYSAATSSETMSMMGSGSTSASKDRVQAHHVVYRGYTLRFFGQLCDYVSIPLGQMTTFVFDLDKGEGYIDGKLVLEQKPEVLPSDDNIYLFAKNANGKADWEYAGSCRIYGYKHYRDGALVRDMIPCRREADGVYGLYDLVNGKFYTKSGEGTLAYEPLELIGEAGIVMNMETGEVYYSKNINWKNAMASLVKIMTCVVTLENADLNGRTVPVIKSDLVDGSNMGLVEWESLTVLDALYGLMVPSGCDAAQLLARTVAGDYDSFVDMMNAKAKELGMTDTVFSCPSGLDDKKQSSTVADMIKLMRYAMENEVFRQLISTKSYQIKADNKGTKDHVLVTTNNLLGVYEGCIGGKTGTTTASGAHVIEVAKRHGSTLIAMICSSEHADRYNDVTKLLDYGFTKTPEHVYEPVVTEPTCTEQGYTTYTCQCGEGYVGSYVESLGHALRDLTMLEEPVPGKETQMRCDCVRCDYSEVQTIRYDERLLKLEGEDLLKQQEIWINGLPYPVIKADKGRYLQLPTAGEQLMVTYSYHVGDANNIHTQYPTGMKVYKVSQGKITYIEELDDLLQYSGSSIRMTGNKGIRMITSLTKENKEALTGDGLAGYKLVEYGTAIAWAKEIQVGDALVLGKSFARSNYAYKKGVADPVFAKTKDLVQYTNVLVGFNDDQCKDDIAMRPYIILEDAEGERITLYGGTVYRSIGYIAYQNRNVVKKGTAAYQYVWDIIHHVYGKKYDADFKG